MLGATPLISALTPRPRPALSPLYLVSALPKDARVFLRGKGILTLTNKECFQLQVTENQISGRSTVRTSVYVIRLEEGSRPRVGLLAQQHQKGSRLSPLYHSEHFDFLSSSVLPHVTKWLLQLRVSNLYKLYPKLKGAIQKKKKKKWVPSPWVGPSTQSFTKQKLSLHLIGQNWVTCPLLHQSLAKGNEIVRLRLDQSGFTPEPGHTTVPSGQGSLCSYPSVKWGYFIPTTYGYSEDR